MSDDEHLEKLFKQHEKDPKQTGCIWRHAAGYRDESFPDCSHRFIAHEYSKDNETNIYDIPNSRVSQQDIDNQAQGLPSHGGWGEKKKLRSLAGTGWHLGSAPNFTIETVPYWHNTHHCIACGEITANFDPEDEIEIILNSRWNINQMPNVIILPKQPQVATLLKLPTHVPPDGIQSHPNYSLQIGNGLQSLKQRLASIAEKKNGHKLTDSMRDRCRKSLENCSAQLRQLLLDEGLGVPGINLDKLNLSRINWAPVPG